MKADKTYTKNDYLTIDDMLYKVIADSITQGSDIIIEGIAANVEKVTIGDELTKLFNSLS